MAFTINFTAAQLQSIFTSHMFDINRGTPLYKYRTLTPTYANFPSNLSVTINDTSLFAVNHSSLVG